MTMAYENLSQQAFLEDGDRYETEQQVSEWSGFPVRTLQNLRQRGEGPPFYKIGRLVRYRRYESMAYFNRKRVTSTSEHSENRQDAVKTEAA